MNPSFGLKGYTCFRGLSSPEMDYGQPREARRPESGYQQLPCRRRRDLFVLLLFFRRVAPVSYPACQASAQPQQHVVDPGATTDMYPFILSSTPADLQSFESPIRGGTVPRERRVVDEQSPEPIAQSDEPVALLVRVRLRLVHIGAQLHLHPPRGADAWPFTRFENDQGVWHTRRAASQDEGVTEGLAST